MQYLLMICHDDAFAPTDTLVADIAAWVEHMDGRGLRVHGNPLRPPAEAATVRVRDGRAVLTGGPCADTAEHLCAYELIECESMAAAVDAASSHPMATTGRKKNCCARASDNAERYVNLLSGKQA